MTERVWQMRRISAGDYLLPSNDRRTLWRISRYHEDGSLERHDGTKVRGDFWRAARHRQPYDEIAPHLIGAAPTRSRGVDEALERFLDWDTWVEHACLLPTRDAAIQAALEAT